MSDKKRVVLLIEDDEVDREAIHRLLDDIYDVQTAEMGYVGLELARKNKPDAILLDYRLPDVDGLEVLTPLLAMGFPVIISTVEESPEIIIETMKAGAHDYLVKRQMTTLSLDQIINQAIEKARLQRELEARQRQVAEQAERLEQQNEKIRELASALTLAEQQERRRISQTLHDNVQQILHGLHVRMLLLSSDLSPQQRDGVQEHIEEMENLVDQALEIVRTLSVDLSPPLLKGEGLDVALEWLAGQMTRRHGLDIDLNVEVECYIGDDNLRVLLFQMTRELLFNVVKHADVERARLDCFRRGDDLIVGVIDEGVGFEAAALATTDDRQGFGLYSIRERLHLFGGRLQIESIPGDGTQATIIVPLERIGVSMDEVDC